MQILFHLFLFKILLQKLNMKLQLQKLEKNKFSIFYNVEFVLEKAVELMISGFCREIFTKLPLEFAAEADKLLTLKLEGSVG
jgi:Fe-S cluster assembly protein SufB